MPTCDLHSARERERQRGRERGRESGLSYCNSSIIKPGLPPIEYSLEHSLLLFRLLPPPSAIGVFPKWSIKLMPKVQRNNANSFPSPSPLSSPRLPLVAGQSCERERETDTKGALTKKVKR